MQPRAAGGEEGHDFLYVQISGPIDNGVHFEADIHMRGIRAFHKNLSPTHSQNFGVDRGPEGAIAECCCTPVAADMSDRYPNDVYEVWWKWRAP